MTKIAYSPAEAAAELSVHDRTIRNLIKRGKLRTFYVGRCVRIPTADIQQMVDGATLSHGGDSDGTE
jgi:excisionase family DNA binding protein